MLLAWRAAGPLVPRMKHQLLIFWSGTSHTWDATRTACTPQATKRDLSCCHLRMQALVAMHHASI